MFRGTTTVGESIFFVQGRRSTYFGSALVVAAVLSTGVARADTVTAVGDDNNLANPSSFNSPGSLAINNTTGTNGTPVWSNGLAPAPGNDYVVQSVLMRTPGAAGSFTFFGDSLSFIDGGQFRTKNGANTDILTVNKLIVDGGHIAWNANPVFAVTIAGNIQVGPNGMTVYNRAVSNNFGTITSNISDVPGSPGGVVAIGGAGLIASSVNQLTTLTPAIANSYTGQTYLMGGNVQLGNVNALPSTTTLVFGSAGSPVNVNSNAGAATLDLNGLTTVSVAGLAVQSYTASGPVSLLSGGQPTSNTPTGLSIPPQAVFTVRVNQIPPGTVKIGQAVDGVGVSGTRVGVIGVYNTASYTDIVLESNTANTSPPSGTGFNNTTAGLTGLSFEATSPNPARQIIGNGLSNSNAILTITGASTFGGTIQNAVVANPNGGTLATNATTGITFNPSANGSTLTLGGANTYTGTTTVMGTNSTLVLNYTGTSDNGNIVLSGANAAMVLNNPNNLAYSGVISGATGNLTKGSIGNLALSAANTYGGATTISGGVVTLDFSATGAPTSNILYNSGSPASLTLNAATLTLKGGSTAANSQQFSGLTLSAGGSSIVLSSNATAQPLALNVGSITRSPGGILLLTNPSGILSATNGLQTTSGSAGTLLTNNGVPFVVVNGNDWGAKDATNLFVTALSSYTASTATTLSGNANVVTDVNLASGGSVGSIRFNDAAPRTITVSSGSLSAGGILMTSVAGNATITGGSLQSVGVGGELALVQGSTTNVLNISSNIVDNGTSGLTTAGVGKTVLSGQNSYAGKTLIGSGTVQFSNAQSLYNNTPASWTANNISVSSGATFGLNVGGAGEFTAANVATLAALGTATGGLKNGANLALDTTNAAGGVFTLTSPITNTNGGANAIGLTKNGVGTLQLAAGANNYTSPTTINKGTLQLTAANSLTGNTAVTIVNDVTAKFDLNGFDTSIGGLSGGGTTGGTVALGAGNLTLNGASSATYAGSFTGTGAINFNLGVFGSNATTQTLSGPGYTGGALTVANGTVTLSPTSPTTWGSTTTTHYVASLNSSSATLTVGANATLAADKLVLAGNLYTSRDTSTGGTAVLNVNAATSKVTANTLNFGMSLLPFDSGGSQNPPVGTLPLTFQPSSQNATATLSNGTIELAGTTMADGYQFVPNYSASTGASPVPTTLIPGPVNVAMIMAPDNAETATMNISGSGNLKIDNNSLLIFGKTGNRTATITQSGGNVTFYSDAGTTVGGTGGIFFCNTSNAANAALVYTYNLNGGTLTVPQIFNNGPGGTSAGILVLNGGTLKPTADTTAFITTGPSNGASNNTPQVRVGANAGNGGAIIDTGAFNVTLGSALLHSPGLAAGVTDDGLKKMGSGTLILDKASTYTGTTNILAGVLQTTLQNGSSTIVGTATVNGGATLINVGPTGIYDASNVSFLNPKQTLSGTGHVTGSFSHSTPGSVITGGGVGTAGTLTFDSNLDLAGGVLRADLDQTATTYDKIVVSPNSGFNASGSPSGSIVDIEFTGALPTAKTTYSIVNYSGNFAGNTNNITWNGTQLANPTSLIFTSSNNNVVGRNTQLAVNNTTHTLDVIYQPGPVAGDLIWTGGTAHNSTVWDTNTTANWNNLVTSTNPDTFFIRDKVTFDNSPGVPHAITVDVPVAPLTITVNSDGANNFSFSGTGKVTGTGSLTKSGTSTLTIATANDYTGGTTISAGTVIAADAASSAGFSSALGAGTTTIAAGATLQVGNGTAGAGTLPSGPPITNNGSLVVNRPDQSTLNAAITGTGTLAIQGGGTVSLKTNAVANASTYTGNTTVSGGSTLQLGQASATSINSVINVENTTGTRFTLNGFDAVVGGLSGGGPISGELTIGANNFTIAGLGTNNLTYSGPISSINGTLFIGRTQNQNDENGTSRVVALTSKDAIQTIAGDAITMTGPTTVRVGTINFAPSVATSIGSTANSVNITAPVTLPYNSAPANPANVTFATLTTNANTTLLANNFTLNPDQNSLSNFVENGGQVQVNGTVSMGNSRGGSTITLNGGNFIAGGSAVFNNSATSIRMAEGPAQQFGPNTPNAFNTINVNSGATLSIVNQLAMGQSFNAPCTINQNGGTVQFVNATSLTPGGTGGWNCVNNNAANFGQYVWNLNGGTLAMNYAKLNLFTDPKPATTVPNILPVLNFNGGTLQAISDQPTEMFDHRYSLVARANGGTIDTNSHIINFTAPISHDATLGNTTDGGITILDSVGGGGTLTYSIGNTYTGPTKIGAGGNLILGISDAINGSSKVDFAGGTLTTGGLDQDMSAATKLKVSANSTLDLGHAGNVRFADSTAAHWKNGTKLTINNASGGHVFVGNSSSGLNPNELPLVQFSGSPAGAILSATGELQPGTPTGGTIQKLGDVNHNANTNSADIGVLITALADVNSYVNGLTLDTGWTSKAAESVYLADVNFNDRLDNGDLQALLDYLKAGGNGSNSPGGSGGSVAPVPEPSTWVLLGLGSLIVGGRRYYRKCKVLGRSQNH